MIGMAVSRHLDRRRSAMFDTLVVSGARSSNLRHHLPASLFSLVTHALVAYGAVKATERRESPLDVLPDTRLVYLGQTRPEPPSPAPAPPREAFRSLIPAVAVPTSIPPIEPDEPFDPRDYSGVGVELDVVSRAGTPGPVALMDVFEVTDIDEPPEAISFPPPEYPRAQLLARIEGSVLMQAVIDTTGRAEPASILVVGPADRALARSAREAMRRALFRPGRIHGLAVRVLVQMPVRFVMPRD
jgi:TonB family protein